MMTPIQVLGYNSDVDSGSNEDLWTEGGTYSFPSSAAATKILSDNANDDSSGTGARTVRVEGLDENLQRIEEVATMNGTSDVNLDKKFYRVNKAIVLTAGSGGENAGKITVQHGSTVLCAIPASTNRSLQAIFTPWAGLNSWVIRSLYVLSVNNTAAFIQFQLKSRKNSGLWVPACHPLAVESKNNHTQNLPFRLDIHVDAGEDLRIEVDTDTDNVEVYGGFDIIGSSRPLSYQ